MSFNSVDIVFTSYSDFEYKDVSINYICELNDMFLVWKFIKRILIVLKILLMMEYLLIKGLLLRVNFDNFVGENEMDYVSKMGIVSQGWLVNLVKNSFGVGLLIKEFVENDIGKTLFCVKSLMDVSKRNLFMF